MPSLANRTRAGKRRFQFEVQDQEGQIHEQTRVRDQPGAIQEYLSAFAT